MSTAGYTQLLTSGAFSLYCSDFDTCIRRRNWQSCKTYVSCEMVHSQLNNLIPVGVLNRQLEPESTLTEFAFLITSCHLKSGKLRKSQLHIVVNWFQSVYTWNCVTGKIGPSKILVRDKIMNFSPQTIYIYTCTQIGDCTHQFTTRLLFHDIFGLGDPNSVTEPIETSLSVQCEQTQTLMSSRFHTSNNIVQEVVSCTQ